MVMSYADIQSLLESRQPRLPVYCIYPHVYRRVAEHFVSGFPGRVLYAVKANNHPYVIEALYTGGITHFDCASLQEVQLVKSLLPQAKCYLMNPVRLAGDARRAYEECGTRHFMIDHRSGLAPLLEEVQAADCVVFARMAVSHHSAMADLSSKFGAPPDDIPAILQDIRDAGAEPALAFNVGTGVTEPEAYTYAMGLAREVLEGVGGGRFLADSCLTATTRPLTLRLLPRLGGAVTGDFVPSAAVATPSGYPFARPLTVAQKSPSRIIRHITAPAGNSAPILCDLGSVLRAM